MLTCIGLVTYALIPTLFPQHAYAGLMTGTIIFSVAAGLCEVLLSPMVAALPSDNPEREMSTLHSLYAYGVVLVVTVSTVFLKIFGTENWMYLTLFWALLPVVSAILFCVSPLPEMNFSHSEKGSKVKNRQFGIALCVVCIFLGSAAENTMSSWISGYMENALKIPKAVGDILGLTLFAVLLGIGRTLYAKRGKNISNVLFAGMIGASVCYLVVGLSSAPIVSMIACIVTGICTSMLWPGTLLLMEEKFPNPGVTAYALMAAGGDLGGSVAPQLLGGVVDAVSASDWGIRLSESLSLSPDQIGMKIGMLTSAIFPLLGIGVIIYIRKYFKKQNTRSL